MATLTSTTGVGGILPPDYAALIVEPVNQASVAMQASTVVTTAAHTYHVPIVRDDAGASWVAEGDEITASDAVFDEQVVEPAKVAGLSVISRELADDSQPAAQAEVGRSLARSITKQVDAAFFGNMTPPAPPGIESAAGMSTVDAGAEYANADAFAEGLSAAEQQGAAVTTWVTDPATALTLATIKDETGSNRALLGDVANGTQRQLLGVPLLVSPHVTAGVVYGIPAARTLVIRRTDVRLEISRDAHFSTDQVSVRAVMRVGFAYPTPASIVRISTTAGT